MPEANTAMSEPAPMDKEGVGTRLLIGGLTAVVVLAVLALTSLHSPSEAAPAVSWAPSSVDREVAAGASTMVIASFTASQNLSGVTVRVVPELAAYVTVEPTSLSQVTKGKPVNLVLTITAPEVSPLGSVDGTVQLRKDGDGVYAKPLPVTISVRERASFTPPDPGEAGKLTVAGVDADGDGVRDDIQLYIARTYSNPDQQRALRQFVKGIQGQLVHSGDDDLVAKFDDDESRGLGCILFILGEDEMATAWPELQQEIVNTEERLRAYAEAAKTLGGRSYGVPPVDRSFCD